MVEVTTGRASEEGHFYDRSGRPCYEVRSANGTMRKATLRDAKKYGWVPGFSTIAKMEHQEGLVRWRIEQAILAAITLPGQGENETEYKARVHEDADKQAEVARDRGTHLHGAIESHYVGAPTDAADAPFVWPVVAWLDKRFPGVKWKAEQSFAHPLGFGGKIDLSCDVAVVDFKFKDFDADKMNKILAKSGHYPGRGFGYDQHEMQLHVYERGLGLRNAAKVNLFISSTVPNLIVPVEWPTNDKSWEAFLCLLRLYQIRKNYDSSFEREAA